MRARLAGSSFRARTAAVAAALLAVTGIGAVALAPPAVADGPTTFSNTAAIVIGSPEDVGEVEAATPYPADVTVSEMSGPVTEVSVTLHGVSHLFVNDIDVLLVAPSGENLVMMSDVGESTFALSAAGADITLADGGEAFPTSGSLASGAYAPTNEDGAAPDTFPAPAPTPGASTTLAGAFSGIDPNGTWSLYVVDDATGDDGEIVGGWSITITTSETQAPTEITASAIPNPILTTDAVTLTAHVNSDGQPVPEGIVRFEIPGLVGYEEDVVDGVAAVSFSEWRREGVDNFVVTYLGTETYLSSATTLALQADDPTQVTGNLYCNPPNLTATTIPAVGPAQIYPLRVFVDDLAGGVSDVKVHLNGLRHASTGDLDVMLVSPSGDSLLFLSDVSGELESPTDLVFSDDGDPLTLLSGPGEFVPTNLDGAHDGFPAPAPAPSAATSFADAFEGTTASGTWAVYIVDNAPGDAGFLEGDWCLELTAGVATEVVLDAPATVTAGNDVEVTATVTAEGDPVDVGTVSYAVGGGAVVEAGTPDADGEVTFTLTALERGVHAITASYVGDDGFGSSEADPIEITATEGTAVTIDAPSTIAVDSSLTVEVTVTADGGDPVTAGSVTYIVDGGTPVGVGNPDADGQVTFTITDLPRGDHMIVAEYVGAQGWLSSSSDGHDVLVQQGTTISLAAPSTVTVGDDVDVTATVVGVGGGAVTEGTVTYSVDGGAPVNAGTPDAGGEVDFTLSGLARGTHTIDATYTGADGWTDSVAIQVEVLAQAATSIVIDAPASVDVGDDVTVTVSVTSDGHPVDGGTVTYAVDDGTPVDAGTPSADGEVTITLPGLDRGTHTIDAGYTGTDGWLDSEADQVEVLVIASTATTITVDPVAPRAHEPLTISATVTGDGGSVTEGMVRVTIDATAVEVAADELAGETFDLTPTSTDDIQVLVEYFGSDDFGPSSQTLTITPTEMPTTLVLTAPDTAVDGDTVPLEATVTVDAAGVTASGAVAFTAGETVLGTATLVDGTAELPTALPAGALTVVATLIPGDGFAASDDEAPVAVTPLAAAGGPYAIAEGDAVTLSAAGSSSGAIVGWDLDGDGDFSDATGTEVTLTWSELEAFGIDDGPATYQIAAQGEIDGLTAIAPGEIEVSNTGPDVIVDGPSSAAVGQPLTLKVSADDPSSADMAELFTYIVDWGDGSPVVEVVGPADPPVTHTYTQAGDVEATFSVIDRDGDGGGSLTLTITVTPAQADPGDDPTSTGGDTPSASPLPDSGISGAVAAAIVAAAILLIAGTGLALLRRRLTR